MADGEGKKRAVGWDMKRGMVSETERQGRRVTETGEKRKREQETEDEVLCRNDRAI